MLNLYQLIRYQLIIQSQQQNKSVMDQNEKYQYNFQYSLANYHPICQEEPEEDSDFCEKDEQTILRRSNELIDYKCFANNKTQQIFKTLFTHFIQLYGRVAVRLFRICQKIFQNLTMTSSSFIRNFQEIIHHERQKLVENISQLSKIFYDEKTKYFKLISLCVSGSIFKILTLQKDLDQLKFQQIFHTVYWQMTGTHSTDKNLTKLMEQTFNVINFHKYLINEESTKIYAVKSVTQSFSRNSISFSNALMNFSIKDMVNKSINQSQKQNEQISFSKKIKRKEKPNKQNSALCLNEHQINDTLKPNKVIHTQAHYQNQEVYQLPRFEQGKSNQKACNFKKDRAGIFQNYTKSKSGKKLFAQFGSSSKKPSFANYLQQKKLYF